MRSVCTRTSAKGVRCSSPMTVRRNARVCLFSHHQNSDLVRTMADGAIDAHLVCSAHVAILDWFGKSRNELTYSSIPFHHRLFTSSPEIALIVCLNKAVTSSSSFSTTDSSPKTTSTARASKTMHSLSLSTPISREPKQCPRYAVIDLPLLEVGVHVSSSLSLSLLIIDRDFGSLNTCVCDNKMCIMNFDQSM